jgi:hypothetical protein
MSGPLRIILVAVSLLAIVFCLYRIRKSRLKINYALFWIGFSFLLLVISVFPQIPFFFSDLCGIQSPVNFVFLFMIFILLYQLFKLTTRLSHLEEMIEELSEEIAVKEQMLKKDDH